ncbi:hypothetical protein ACQKFU_33420 [Bacillus mycoides]|uniref:hypothetical protein n=1 Tax=Bacillus mycoides TaxID=1405 RepID=UPI003CFEEC15
MLYPVALTNEQNKMLQMSSMLFQALKVVFDKPQGQARGYTNTFLPVNLRWCQLCWYSFLF